MRILNEKWESLCLRPRAPAKVTPFVLLEKTEPLFAHPQSGAPRVTSRHCAPNAHRHAPPAWPPPARPPPSVEIQTYLRPPWSSAPTSSHNLRLTTHFQGPVFIPSTLLRSWDLLSSLSLNHSSCLNLFLFRTESLVNRRTWMRTRSKKIQIPVLWWLPVSFTIMGCSFSRFWVLTWKTSHWSNHKLPNWAGAWGYTSQAPLLILMI